MTPAHQEFGNNTSKTSDGSTPLAHPEGFDMFAATKVVLQGKLERPFGIPAFQRQAHEHGVSIFQLPL